MEEKNVVMPQEVFNNITSVLVKLPYEQISGLIDQLKSTVQIVDAETAPEPLMIEETTGE